MLPPSRRGVSKVPLVIALVAVAGVVVGAALANSDNTPFSTATSNLTYYPAPSVSTSTTASTSATSSAASSSSTTSSSSASASASGTTASSSTRSGSSTSVVVATFISDLNADVSNFGLHNLSYNESFYQGEDFYSGQAGFAFDAEIQITYNQCTNQCPTEVTNITTIEPGFLVQANYPIQGQALGTTVEQFDFVVTVTPPQTNYNGPLVFYCTMAQ